MAIGLKFFMEEQSQPNWGAGFSVSNYGLSEPGHVFVDGGLTIGESDGFVGHLPPRPLVLTEP